MLSWVVNAGQHSGRAVQIGVLEASRNVAMLEHAFVGGVTNCTYPTRTVWVGPPDRSVLLEQTTSTLAVYSHIVGKQ